MVTKAPDPSDRSSIPPLDYRGPLPRERRPSRASWIADVSHIPAYRDLQKWWLARIGYYLAMMALFVIIAFYAGPNEINFGSPFGLRASAFVPYVMRDCVPVVRAMKEYQRDHGSFPGDIDDLVPQYLSAGAKNRFLGNVYKGQFSAFAEWNHLIEYKFGPGKEEWRIRGPLINGVLPVPAVTSGPATAPTTQPQL